MLGFRRTAELFSLQGYCAGLRGFILTFSFTVRCFVVIFIVVVNPAFEENCPFRSLIYAGMFSEDENA